MIRLDQPVETLANCPPNERCGPDREKEGRWLAPVQAGPTAQRCTSTNRTLTRPEEGLVYPVSWEHEMIDHRTHAE